MLLWLNNDRTGLLKGLAAILFLTAIFTITSCRKVTDEVPDKTARTDSILDHTDNLLNSGQLGRSIIYLDSAYNAFQQPGPIDLWRKYKQKLNYYLNYEVNLTRARQYADSMATVLKGHERIYKEQHAWTLFANGDVCMAEKKYTEAFKNYYDGREFARLHLDTCSFSQFSYQLGLVRYRQEQYARAVPYLKQAMAEKSHCKDGSGFYNLFFTPQTEFNTTALCYEQSGKLDSAIYYYRHGLAFIEQEVRRFPEKKQFAEIASGVFYGNLGGVYARLGNYGQAEKYLKEDIRINSRPGYATEDAQTAEIKLAKLYLKFAHYKEADTVLRKLGADLFAGRGKSQENKDIWLKWYKLKWQMFDKTHDQLQAYLYLQKYDSLLDSVSQVSEGLKTADMDRAFRDNGQQYKLALLSKNDQLKTFSLLAVLIFAVMTVSILGVVWYNLKRSREANHHINEQNTQMQKALGALEQSQEENTRMMQIVAHDLRNPIGGITSIASMMLEERERPTEDRMMLELIKTSGQSSLELVSDLLQVHIRVEELKKEPVDLSVMLHYCVELLHFKAEAKGQQIDLKAEPVTLSVNREKMWRVISNLIANAIKFSPSGAIIKVEMQEKEGHILIAVEDHGIGIPGELKDKIFDMFTEAKRLGTAGEQPFGLGLAISKQIVEAHGGKIWFDSKLNNGTIFYVKLPV
jgi:signal transduction histidine kinase